MRKFKLDSIFTRRSDDYEPQREKSTGGVLAVWGAPGSGKTTVAVKLAKHLADHKRNVALVLCDMTAPMLPCVCTPSTLEGADRSLGSILAATRVTDSLVKNNCVTHKQMPYLAILGLKPGENEYSYPACTQQQVTELITVLRELAPYVIIDCSSYIASDILSAMALLEADSVLRLAGCDPKSLSYFKSQLPLLEEKEWDADRQYTAISNLRPNQAAGPMEQALGGAAFRLPYSAELEEQYLASDLFAPLSLKDSRPFRKELARIGKEVFDV